MSIQIIKPRNSRSTEKGDLKIAELFSNTIQGEGYTMGAPAVFLRMQNCTLNCVWCDTTEVWRNGEAYSTEEVLKMLKPDILESQHLVLTGGSPILQQKGLEKLLRQVLARDGRLPILEVENECTLIVEPFLLKEVKYWNLSPKLSSCQMREALFYRPGVIKELMRLAFGKVTFKFVISKKEDIEEMESRYIDYLGIDRDSVFLMPEADTKAKLEEVSPQVLDWAVQGGYRFSTRLHLLLWDQKVSV